MTDADTTTPPPAKKRGNLTFILTIAAMVALFALVLINRNAIRSHYWADRLPRADRLSDRTYYANCLTAVGEDAFGAVLGLTREADPAVRIFAIHILDQIPSPDTTRTLESMLGDADETVRATISVKLGFRAADETGGELKERLIAKTSAQKPEVAASAVVALEYVHTLDALDAICRAASKHPAAFVRAQAIESIGTWLRSTPEYVAMPAFQTPGAATGAPDPAKTLIDALADTATFTATLAFERQMQALVVRADPQAGPGCVYASAENRPAVVLGTLPRTVADVAAETLSTLLGEHIDPQPIPSDAAKQALAARVRQSLIDAASQPEITLPPTAPAEPSSAE